MKIYLPIRRIIMLLVIIMILLAVAHIINLFLYFIIADPDQFDFIKLIDFDYEGNLPTVFSSMILFFSAVLLYLIAVDAKQSGKPDRAYWLGLALVFAFLSIDEGVGLHEEVGDFTELFIETGGFLYFTWVIPYSVLILVFVILYLQFLLRLPRSTRSGFIAAGLMFVSGSMGLEMLSAKESSEFGNETITYSALYTVEELLEMSGVILFINYLLQYIEFHIGTVCLTLGKSSEND